MTSWRGRRAGRYPELSLSSLRMLFLMRYSLERAGVDLRPDIRFRPQHMGATRNAKISSSYSRGKTQEMSTAEHVERSDSFLPERSRKMSTRPVAREVPGAGKISRDVYRRDVERMSIRRR